MQKYGRGVRWLQEVLHSVKFTKDRLLVVATKMINDVARWGEREGRGGKRREGGREGEGGERREGGRGRGGRGGERGDEGDD